MMTIPPSWSRKFSGRIAGLSGDNIIHLVAPSSILRGWAFDLIVADNHHPGTDIIRMDARFQATGIPYILDLIQEPPKENSRNRRTGGLKDLSIEPSLNLLLCIDHAYDLTALKHYPDGKKFLEKLIRIMHQQDRALILGWTSLFLIPDIMKGTAIVLDPLLPEDIRWMAQERRLFLSAAELQLLVYLTDGQPDHLEWIFKTDRLSGISDMHTFLDRELCDPSTAGFKTCLIRWMEILAQSRGFAALKSTMRTLADHPGLRLSRIAEKTRSSAQAARDYLLELIRVGAVCRDGWTYRLTDPVLARFIRIHSANNRKTVESETGSFGLPHQLKYRKKELEID